MKVTQSIDITNNYDSKKTIGNSEATEKMVYFKK